MAVHDEAAVETWICPSNLSPQPYQLDIIKDALMSNGLIMLPAGVDHLLIISVLFYNFERYYPSRKCVMLLPSSDMAESARSGFNRMVANRSKSTVLSAQQSPTERGLQWSSPAFKYYFTTPQTFNNDILNRNCSLSSVSAIVLDPLDKLLEILITKDLLRTVRESTSQHRVIAFADLNNELTRFASRAPGLISAQHISCFSLHSGPFTTTLERLSLITVPVSEEHQLFIDHFEQTEIKPILEKIMACNRNARFPPIGKLSIQITSRIKETCFRSLSSNHVDSLFLQLCDLLKLRDDLQYNEYHNHNTATPSPPMHPKTLFIRKYMEQSKPMGNMVIISVCRKTCDLLRVQLNGPLVIHVGELADLQVCSADHILFSAAHAFFHDQRCTDQILAKAGFVGILLLENYEALLFERLLQTHKDEVVQAQKLSCTNVRNSITLPKIPDLVLMAFDEPAATDVLMDSRPERSFITEKMLIDAPYPTFDPVSVLEGVSFKVGHSVKTLLFNQILESNDQISHGEDIKIDSRPDCFIASWIARHVGLVNLTHHYVPPECYLPTRATPLVDSENVNNRRNPREPVENLVVKRIRGQVIESSDQLSSPVFKRPRKEYPAKAASESRFVDIEAGVSGSDVDDDELEECSSMLDFIDDRSEVTVMSSCTATESQSQSQTAHSSMMAFYRQSLLSSQPSAFSQPAGRFGRKLKVKIPEINVNADEVESCLSNATSESPPISSTDVLGSALQEMDWSDEDLGI